MNEARHDETKHAPFDTARLDALLEDEGIDVLQDKRDRASSREV